MDGGGTTIADKCGLLSAVVGRRRGGTLSLVCLRSFLSVCVWAASPPCWLSYLHVVPFLQMTDPTVPLHMPSDRPADCAASSHPIGSPPSEQRPSAAGDRREEGHEAAVPAANRAQDTKSPVSEAAHRPARRPSPTLGPIDHFPHQACTRSQAHHRIPPTSIPPSPTPSSNASSCSLPLPDLPFLLSHMLPDDLLRRLRCPLCPPGSLLRAPVTLHCGHTFCASHFAPHNVPSTSKDPEATTTLPQCCLPTCSPSSRSLTTFSHTPPTDVTTNKLLELLDRASREDIQPESPSHFSDDYDEHTDSDRELESDPELEYLPLLPVSPSSPSSSSPTRELAGSSSAPGSSSPRRPRSLEASPCLHPRKRRRRIRLPAASTQPHAQHHHRNDHDRYTSDRLEKELLTELSCEICFGLFWQPITTPCQHVSPLRFAISHETSLRVRHGRGQFNGPPQRWRPGSLYRGRRLPQRSNPPPCRALNHLRESIVVVHFAYRRRAEVLFRPMGVVRWIASFRFRASIVRLI